MTLCLNEKFKENLDNRISFHNHSNRNGSREKFSNFCRYVRYVNGFYYMSSTTMHLSPGLPHMSSKELTNWELESYAYDTLFDNDLTILENGKSP